MKLIIKDLLEYFDIKESTNYGDTTATISIVGEDLCSGIFKHFSESERKSKINIIDPNQHIPVQMKRIGKRLDRWILEYREEGTILYQTEIKSWCSRAIGGVSIPLDIDNETLEKKVKLNWEHHLPEITSKEGNGINKVLVDMISDIRLGISESYKKKPLLLFWDARKPTKEDNYFFRYSLPEKHFSYDYFWGFSCSLYLRHLYTEGKTEITIDMPNVDRRLKQLNQIFKVQH